MTAASIISKTSQVLRLPLTGHAQRLSQFQGVGRVAPPRKRTPRGNKGWEHISTTMTLVVGFLDLVAVNTLALTVPVWGCPVHCRMFSSIFGLYPLDASTPFPVGKITPSPLTLSFQLRKADLSYSKVIRMEKKMGKVMRKVYSGKKFPTCDPSK